MGALFAVYKRETALYFRSFIGYAIGFALLGFVGLVFVSDLSYSLQSQAQQQPYLLGSNLIVNILAIFSFLMFVIAPLLTMRLISEETREGTLEVLMTLPMGEWVFVLGKFLAAWTYYTFLLVMTLFHVFVVWTLRADLNAGYMFSMYLGAWLYGGAALAVSLIWSAVTEDQLVAAILGAASVLVLFLADGLSVIVSNQNVVPDAADFVRELGMSTHYQQTMLAGIIRGQDIAYFVLLIIISVFITTLIVGTRRWRAA